MDYWCNVAWDECEEDQACQRAAENFDRQRDFQRNLLQQTGGAVDTEVGRFEFPMTGFYDKQSTVMGVRERHFETTLRQHGNFVNQQNLVQALENGFREAVNRVLETDLQEDDKLFFTIASNRLNSTYHAYNLSVRQWRTNEGNRVESLFQRMAKALNSNE